MSPAPHVSARRWRDKSAHARKRSSGRHAPVLTLGLVALLTVVAPRAGAQELDLDDVAGRIDYSFYTEDAGGLRNLIAEVAAAIDKGGDSAELRYAAGLAQYRLGLVLDVRKQADAAGAMNVCIEQADQVLDADARNVEALVLQAACYGHLVTLHGLTAMVNAPLASSRLEKVKKLAPRNPRAALVQAFADYAWPRAVGGDRSRAEEKFKQAVQMFDAAADTGGEPRWGQAEAYAGLGQCLLDSGDTLGARNALERALLQAPDYAAARRLLARVSGSAR